MEADGHSIEEEPSSNFYVYLLVSDSGATYVGALVSPPLGLAVGD